MPAFVLELSPEERIWSLGGLSENVEGSAVESIAFA